MLVFKLDGSTILPEPVKWDRSIPEQPVMTASAEELARGEFLYNEICSICHGLYVASSAMIPDLRLMNEATHVTFNQIVLEGTRSAGGMASFADLLTEADAEKVHAYIVHQANEDRAKALAAEASSGS